MGEIVHVNIGDWRIDPFFFLFAQVSLQPCVQSHYPCEMRLQYSILVKVCGPTAGLEALGRENVLVIFSVLLSKYQPRK
jgi:hypothetical protein